MLRAMNCVKKTALFTGRVLGVAPGEFRAVLAAALKSR